MVTNNHYRWDFIGLSTDQKPTPETSEKVVDGSTFYCSDNSKLYVYCKDNWYERKPLGGGGGGGGTSYTAGNGIDITDDTISVDTETIQEKLTAGSNITISDNTISATDTTYTAGSNITISDGTISATDTTYSNFTGTDGTAAGSAGLVPAPATTDAGKFLKADGTWDTAGGGGGGTGQGMITLSSANFNYDSQGGTNYDTVAIWLLDDGFYKMPDNYTTVPVKGAENGSDMTVFNTAINTGGFKCFIKMDKEFWMFVNSNNQSPSIYADRPIAYYKINPANGFLTVDSTWQLAKRGEITS